MRRELSARGKFTHIYRTKQRFMCLIHFPLFAKYDSSLPWQLSNINGEVLMPSIASIRVMMMKKKAEGKTSQVPLGWKFLRFGSSEKKFNLFNNLCCNTKLEERFWAELSHYSQNRSWLAGGFPAPLTAFDILFDFMTKPGDLLTAPSWVHRGSGSEKKRAEFPSTLNNFQPWVLRALPAFLSLLVPPRV